MDDSSSVSRKPSGLRRKASLNATFCVKKEKSNTYKKIYAILQKPEDDRTSEEISTLENSAAIVKEVNLRLEKRRRLKSRSEEIEDEPDVLIEKCRILADALLNSQHVVVYSGAGVSTAARIPDYRGTNGIWTRLQQGKDIGCHDLSQAEPTLTHMALFAMYRVGIVKHIVSQNCDGLHLRSGIPRSILSEVHGNMYLEVCTLCKIEYWRLFDVTEHTGRYSHKTARLCFRCRKPLSDTIVHFGERGALRWPLNWKGACHNADKADIILCIGSSLKVLKRYPWLWCMDKPVKKRPLLFIVNLQWTPKDDQASLKINGKCDEVMSLVMSYLGMPIPKYIRHLDPIFQHATVLDRVELHTTSQPILQLESGGERVLSAASNSVGNDHVDPTFIVDDLASEDCVGLKLDVVKEEVVVMTTINDRRFSDNTIKMEASDIVHTDCLEIKSGTLSAATKRPGFISSCLTLPASNENGTDHISHVQPSLSDNDNGKLESVSNSTSTTTNADSTNVLSSDFWRPFNDGQSFNDNKAIGYQETGTGFSVSLAEFDRLYSKIGKELARRNSNEFFQEFCKTDEDNRNTDDLICSTANNISVKDSKYQMQSVDSVNVDAFSKSNNCSNELDVLTLSDGKIDNIINYNNSGHTICDNIRSRNSISINCSTSFTCSKNYDLLNSKQQTAALDLSSSKATAVRSFSNTIPGSDKSDKSSSDDGDGIESKDDKDLSSCQFCMFNYGNDICQFYKKRMPVVPDSGPFCYCCDDDTDNDSLTDKDQVLDGKTKPDCNSTANKVAIVNPGWFGKGYRKRIKKKR